MRPRYPKTDRNQSAIIAELEALGLTVIDVSRLPVPALDLFVGGWSELATDYIFVQVEVKTETGELNAAEAEYLAAHPDLPIIKARSAEDVLAYFGRLG